MGYRTLNLGAHIEGETREVAVAMTGIVQSVRNEGLPECAPACVLSGGETTVTLGASSGLASERDYTLRTLPSGVARGVALNATSPVFSAVLAAFLLRERVSKRAVLGIASSVLGTGLLVV